MPGKNKLKKEGDLKVYEQSEELIDLDKKLDELSQFDERMADVVTLRFFGQMAIHATAQVLEISERTPCSSN